MKITIEPTDDEERNLTSLFVDGKPLVLTNVVDVVLAVNVKGIEHGALKTYFGGCQYDQLVGLAGFLGERLRFSAVMAGCHAAVEAAMSRGMKPHEPITAKEQSPCPPPTAP